MFFGKAMLKKGDKVVMHTCLEAETYNGKIWTCAADERIKGEGCYIQRVVFLEGLSACFNTEFLQKLDLKEVTRYVICPYCGHKFLDSDNWEEKGEEYCIQCKNDFTYERVVTIDYESYKKNIMRRSGCYV